MRLATGSSARRPACGSSLPHHDAGARERRLPVTNPNNTDPITPLDPDWRSVPIGTPVITSDGRTIGTVDEKRTDGLHVKGIAPSGGDYMAAPADITRVDTHGVHLLVTSAQTMRARPETTERGSIVPGGLADEQAQP